MEYLKLLPFSIELHRSKGQGVFQPINPAPSVYLQSSGRMTGDPEVRDPEFGSLSARDSTDYSSLTP
jgi:hypothetical protein